MAINRDLAYLFEINVRCVEIQRFLTDKSEAAYLQDDMLKRAVERNLEVIGEASTHLSNEAKERMEGIDWEGVVGQRIILAHVYFELDDQAIYQTAIQDIPPLQLAVSQLEQVLKKE